MENKLEMENDFVAESDRIKSEAIRIEKEIRQLLPNLKGRTRKLVQALKRNYERLDNVSERSIHLANETSDSLLKLNDKIMKDFETVVRLYKEEKEEHSQFYDNFMIAFIYDPRGTFEETLKQLERKRKIESGDGLNNWQWEYHFPLRMRLKIAYRIVFGAPDLIKKENK